MRFMLIVMAGQDEADFEPSVEIVAAMSRYNEELTKAGALLSLDGLLAPTKGARLTFSGGTSTVTDGPFTEAKEVIGGYWIIQAKSKQEAIEWAKRCPLDGGAVLEVRQVAEMSDFSDEIRAAGELSQTPPEQTSAD